AARIDPLDIAALVILGGPGRQEPALGIFVAAIVAQIERPVGAAGEPVRPATRRAERRFAAVRRDAGDRAPGDLAQDHRAVGHRDRPLGKPQPRGYYPYIRHSRPPPLSLYAGILSPRSPERQAAAPAVPGLNQQSSQDSAFSAPA